MLIVALTLGLMGSMHCIGMCGPLAIACSGGPTESKMQSAINGLSYNLGRAVTYAGLGLIFGALGSFLVFTHAQKGLSIAMGVIMIVSFLMSRDLESSIRNLPIIRKWYTKIQAWVTQLLQHSKSYHPFTLGVANGLLPCGLVYLALAGAIASGDIFSGAAFMFVFGLGTLPMLFALSFGSGLIPINIRQRFRKVIPYVTLCFGFYLCYRGVMVDMPMELNFWTAVREPVMCF